MPPSADRFTVQFENVDAAIECAADQTVLSAAVRAGIDHPYGCASGNCGLCLTKVIEGEVNVLPHADAALTEANIARGITLACRAQPRTDVTMRWIGNFRGI